MPVPRHQQQRRQSSPRRDEFAELLSQDLSRAEIMERMNLTINGYKSHYAAVKADLGWVGD